MDAVDLHGGFVNKFQGDAALAIFGAPLEHPDASGAALAAARELHQELVNVLGDNEFGIGVSAGRAIAGHVPLAIGSLMDHHQYVGVWVSLAVLQAVLIVSAFNVRRVRRTVLAPA